MGALANGKHEAVLQAYFADPNRVGWRAYAKVYPNAKQRAAETAWSRLLKNAEFSARVAELDAAVTEKVVEASAITVERVISELAKIGFASAKRYLRLTDDGEPAIDLSQVSEDEFAALAQVTVEDFVDARSEPDEALEPQAHGGELKRRRGRDVRRVTFKLHPKIPALVAIGEHLGAFRRKGEAAPAKADAPDQPQVETTPPSRLEIARRIAFLLRVPEQKPAAANAPVAPAAEPAREKRAPR